MTDVHESELQFRTDSERSWLGGDVPGGDPATFYPELWKWFCDVLGVTSVVDVGCGEGHALRYFRDELECEVLGIDGLPRDDEDIIEWDYTKGAQILGEFWDLCWCCEFVEHVLEDFVPNYLATFRCCNFVALTHAFPGQFGWHHVNTRTPDYWLGVMAGAGFTYRHDLTEQAREQAALNTDEYNHFVRSGMIFER